MSADPNGIPVVAVVPNFYDDIENGGPIVRWLDPLYALIDTGADSNYIDERIILNARWAFTHTVEVEGATSVITGKNYRGEMLILDSMTRFTTDVVTAPLRKNRRAYDLVLGRSFISLGTLVMDYRRAKFYFES